MAILSIGRSSHLAVEAGIISIDKAAVDTNGSSQLFQLRNYLLLAIITLGSRN